MILTISIYVSFLVASRIESWLGSSIGFFIFCGTYLSLSICNTYFLLFLQIWRNLGIIGADCDRMIMVESETSCRR